MKRFIAGLVSLVIVSGAAFAKTWTNYIGVGLGVPVESVESKDSDKIVQAGVVLDAAYTGVHSNVFTVKAGFDSGAVASDDVKIQGDDMNSATFVAFNLGAGYSFVQTEKVLFGTTAMFTGAFNMYEEKNRARRKGLHRLCRSRCLWNWCGCLWRLQHRKPLWLLC